MRRGLLLSTLALCAVLVMTCATLAGEDEKPARPPAAGEKKAPPPPVGEGEKEDKAVTDEEIEGLVKDLGSPDFKKREAATRKLTQIGPRAAAHIEKAATSEDPEVRWRAERIVKDMNAKNQERALGEKEGGAELGRRRMLIERLKLAGRKLPPELEKKMMERLKVAPKGRRPKDFVVPRGRVVERAHAGHSRIHDRQFGVYLKKPSAALSKHLKLDGGLMVERVYEGRPAHRIGLKRYDIVIEVDGKPVKDAGAFAKAFNGIPGGREAGITVIREGERSTITFTKGTESVIEPSVRKSRRESYRPPARSMPAPKTEDDEKEENKEEKPKKKRRERYF